MQPLLNLNKCNKPNEPEVVISLKSNESNKSKQGIAVESGLVLGNDVEVSTDVVIYYFWSLSKGYFTEENVLSFTENLSDWFDWKWMERDLGDWKCDARFM